MNPPESNLEVDQVFPVNNLEIISHNLSNADPKAIHDKISKYESLDTEERLSLVKNIPILLEQLGEEGVIVMKPILQLILKDKENIAISLLDRIGDITKFLERHQSLEENLKTIIIPVLISYLNFNKLETKEKAGKELGILANRFTNIQDRGDFILRHIIQMAHDDSNQENRVVALQMYSRMSDCFGQQLCEQFVGMEILSLGEDPSPKVRKEAVKHLPKFSKVVSRAFFMRLFNLYEAKSKEAANWTIRKACVEIFIDMAQICSVAEREGTLTDILLTLLKDSNKWVKTSAYKTIGKFIYLLKGNKINERLFIEYCRMIDNDVNSVGKQNEIIYDCAFHFPAVLNAMGSARWETDLWKIYEKLTKNPDKKVKQTMSQSLHQIAKLLGSQLTEKYLYKVVDSFVKDKNDDVKLGMIRHMAEIMHVLSEKQREEMIGVFEEFQKDQKKWRIRECISKQLGIILEICRPQITFEYIVPILLKFCSDSVSIVREQAAKQVDDFIQKLTSEEGFQLGLIESVKAFGTSPKYTQRQAFLIMCDKLMNHKELFTANFMDILVKLADDKVVNVKLVLAETIQKHLKREGCLSKQEVFLKLKEHLATDENEEVRGVFLELE